MNKISYNSLLFKRFYLHLLPMIAPLKLNNDVDFINECNIVPLNALLSTKAKDENVIILFPPLLLGIFGQLEPCLFQLCSRSCCLRTWLIGFLAAGSRLFFALRSKRPADHSPFSSISIPLCCLFSTSNPSASTLINIISIIKIKYLTTHPSGSSNQRHIPPHQPCRWRTLSVWPHLS